jgi:hypothetical protein
MSLQGQRQASARAIHGQTGRDYSADMRLMFEAEATIPAGSTWNEAFLIWLNTRLAASHSSLPGAMAAFAASLGVRSWGEVGTFAATGDFLLLEGGDFLLLETGDKIVLE